MGFGALNIGRKSYGTNLFKVQCSTVLLDNNEPEPENPPLITPLTHPVKREPKYKPGERLLKKINRIEITKQKRENEKKKLSEDDVKKISKSMSKLMKNF